jgi:hypothetical protein
MKIGRVLLALNQASRILQGGIITFPPKMADAIIDRVERELASFYLSICKVEVEKAFKALALFNGELDESDVSAPKLSKPARTMLREEAISLMDEELEDVELLLNGWAVKPNLSALINDILPAIARGAADKGLETLDIETLKVMQNLFREAYKKYDSTPANTAWKALSSYTLKRSTAAKDAAQPKTDNKQLNLAELKILEKIQAEAAEWEQKTKFFESFKVKPKKALHREWEVPIDFTGVPSKYPLDALKEGSPEKNITVDLFITKLDKPFGGRWNPEKNFMELIAQNDGRVPTEKQFVMFKALLRSTIEHELRHMMQFFMRNSLKFKKWKEGGSKPNEVVQPSAVERVGTAFPPRIPIPKRKGNAAEDTAYPKADKKSSELYYLDPVEFYPQIGTWVDQFFIKQKLHDFSGSERILADGWKAYVGLPTSLKGIEIAPFFEALKKNDMRLWKKAVAEGWKMLVKKVEDARQ